MILTSLDLESFRQARWERNCQLAAACCLVYEYLLTFNDEISFFWKKRWSFGKIIFLWSRYYSLIFNIGNATVFLQPEPSYNLYVVELSCLINLIQFLTLLIPNSTGNRFFHWQNTGASLQVVTTHIILELRLYAMYGSSKKILALFALLLCGEITVMGTIFGTSKQGAVGTNNPKPGLLLCADADPPNLHWITYYWTSIVIIETILLSLSLRKAYMNLKTGEGGNLMRVLTRDSVLYFIFIFWIYMANQVIWTVNDITLNEIGTGFSFCISAILANRLMISVRKSYYLTSSDTTTNTTRSTYMQSIDFKKQYRHADSSFTESRKQTIMSSIQKTDEHTISALTETADDECDYLHAPQDDYEMHTFSERRGF